MKSIVLSSVVVALLILSGCSSKTPAVDESAQQEVVEQKSIQEVSAVEVETVPSSSVSVTSQDGSETSMMNLENKLQAVYFDFDKFVVRSDMQDEVSNDIEVVNGTASNYMIKIEGNCDEWGSDEYNFALGLKRTSSVKKALVSQGVDEKRITMVSYGESNPVCAEKSRDCWAKNRRVDFKLLP